MSEAQIPTEQSETPVQQELAAETGAANSEQAAAPAPSKPSTPLKLPDWTPLGSIRDYFAEQIRQDGFR